MEKVTAVENIALRGSFTDKETELHRKLSEAIQTKFLLCDGRDFLLFKAARHWLSTVVTTGNFCYDYK